ncbi:SRPBCC family protein [Nocardia huaxiensis]|uniref:SRPBCC family protein n=1 Tax=Nocardia huaxiensis TaxID=2755382 RepID=UPI001E426F2C|nr:SRPBCC family protein [Nocardia huaxiensis]UFS96864.1 SRPBCC family protein [Nocardia huaxiensis]
MSAQQRRVVVERTVDASPETIFDLLADPHRHHEFDGSDTVRPAEVTAPARLFLGAEFTTHMRVVPTDLAPSTFLQIAIAAVHFGKLTNTVLEFEESRRIAWRNFGRHIWRYELVPDPEIPNRTLVRETFDYSTNLLPELIELVGFPARNRESMRDTLDRLAALVTTTVG